MSKKNTRVYRDPSYQVEGGAHSILEMMDGESIKNARWIAHYLEEEGDYYGAAWARVVADSNICVNTGECYVDEGKLKKYKKNGKPYNHTKALKILYDRDLES